MNISKRGKNKKIKVTIMLFVLPSPTNSWHMKKKKSAWKWFPKDSFLATDPSEYFGHVQYPMCPWIVNYKEQVHDAICTHSLYHLLHNGVQNKPAEQNKGKAPLGKAVTGLWSYLTCLQRDWLWCSENSSQTVTHSHENNCQMCSWAHRLPCRQHRHELLFILCSKCLLTVS